MAFCARREQNGYRAVQLPSQDVLKSLLPRFCSGATLIEIDHHGNGTME
jgi:hypothetical protein